MRKGDPREVALALLNRSQCSVQVSAVLADSYGIYAWGWNNMGLDGLGEHAEVHCLRRSNRSRWPGSVLYVAARRRRNNKPVNARPCEECQKYISVKKVVYRGSEGLWRAF